VTVALSRRLFHPLEVLAHNRIEPKSLDVARQPLGSLVIIWTPWDEGVLTAVVTSGPTNGAVWKEKMLIVPSQRPTAKCSLSSQRTTCARLNVVPCWVIGSVAGATAWRAASSACRERRAFGRGISPVTGAENAGASGGMTDAADTPSNS